MLLNTPVSPRQAHPADWRAIQALRRASRLPLEGAREHIAASVVARADREVVGCAGAEPRGGVALLRSVVAAIAGDLEAADGVERGLPETGVRSASVSATEGIANGSCCDGAAWAWRRRWLGPRPATCARDLIQVSSLGARGCILSWPRQGVSMRPLPILWKRLVDEGETCPRCRSTQRNVASAVDKLEAALRPLGIEPVLQAQAIDDASFRAAPAESNRIWIGGKPMEEWLGATPGSSPCCEVCGDLPCRTMELDGQTYEAIPEDLIVKAGIMAASALVGHDGPVAETACCSTGCRCG